MERRILSRVELAVVQKSIIRKEISATELLAEIYDHYVTHLETLRASDFHAQLAILDEKWNQDYCKQLQRDLQNSINKSIRTVQWRLAKSYFTWPKMAFTLAFLILISYCIVTSAWQLQVILFILPLLFLISLGVTLHVRSCRKNKEIKKLFNFRNSGIFILSFQSSNFLNYIQFPFHSFLLLLLTSRVWELQSVLPEYVFHAICIVVGFYLVLHSVAILEAWKIKSKTALL
jgi:hypothetical protein